MNTTNKNILYCSFCGKSQHEVRKLIAGPTVFICDECVELCMDILKDDNKNNKSLNDFYLVNHCKHFIVGPTSFHWWGAWLNENPNKICIRPSNLNPSNNIDFWPEDWLSI